MLNRHITPRAAYRWGMRSMLTAGPLALAMLVSWGLRLHVLGARPQLALMLYMLFLLVAVSGFAVAVLASLHSAIGKAFGHGYQTGVQVGQAGEGAPQRPHVGADLRVVE